MSQKIDMASWPRREIYGFFSKMSQPFYSVTFKVDVTRLRAFVKEQGLSFYYALIYLTTKAVNQVENFRYAIEDGEVVLLDERLPSFTDRHPDTDLFHIVNMPPAGDDIAAFCRAAKEKSAAQAGFLEREDTPDLIFLTCVPWVELTGLTNERDFDPDDTMPRIAWGKYAEHDGRWSLQMSLELNHRFLDGLHVGRFYEALTGMIEAL